MGFLRYGTANVVVVVNGVGNVGILFSDKKSDFFV